MNTKKSSFDVFEEFKLLNLAKVMGGDYWREGSTMPHPDRTSDSDEELVTTGSGSTNYLDSQYDCGDGKVVW